MAMVNADSMPSRLAWSKGWRATRRSVCILAITTTPQTSSRLLLLVLFTTDLAHLHADNSVDEEQHGNEQNDVRQRLSMSRTAAATIHPHRAAKSRRQVSWRIVPQEQQNVNAMQTESHS